MRCPVTMLVAKCVYISFFLFVAFLQCIFVALQCWWLNVCLLCPCFSVWDALMDNYVPSSVSSWDNPNSEGFNGNLSDQEVTPSNILQNTLRSSEESCFSIFQPPFFSTGKTTFWDNILEVHFFIRSLDFYLNGYVWLTAVCSLVRQCVRTCCGRPTF